MRNQLAARSTVGTSRRHTRSKTCRSYRRAALSYLTCWQIDFRYVRRNLVPSSPSQRSRQHGFSLCSDTKAKTTRCQLGELWTTQWGLHLKDMRISWRWTWFVIITLPWTHLHTLTHTYTCDCQHCNHFYGSFHNLASRVARHKLFDYAHVIFKPLLRCSRLHHPRFGNFQLHHLLLHILLPLRQ